MSEFFDRHEILRAVAYIFSVWMSWMTSMTLAQFSLIVGAITAVLSMIFTGIMVYVTWRDRIVNYRPPSKWNQRAGDSSPIPLEESGS